MIEGRDFVFIPHADNPSKRERERERATPLYQYTALCNLDNNCQCCLESSVRAEEITAADVDEAKMKAHTVGTMIESIRNNFKTASTCATNGYFGVSGNLNFTAFLPLNNSSFLKCMMTI